MSKLVARIQKLLALAQSDNENEAESAARMARKLMAEHAITEADLAQTKAGRESDPIVATMFSLTGLKLNPDHATFRWARCKTPWWKRNLFFRLAEYLDMRSSYRPSTNVVTLYAYKSDVEVLCYLYETCARQIDKAAKEWLKSLNMGRRGAKSRGVAFRDSAVRGLSTKLIELKRDDSVVSETGTAIMLSKGKAIAQWVEQNQNLRTSTVRRRSDHVTAGYDAGKSVRLHAGIGSSRGNTKCLT